MIWGLFSILLTIAITVFLIGAVILPWMHRASIKGIKEDIVDLQREVSDLQTALHTGKSADPETRKSPATIPTTSIPPPSAIPPASPVPPPTASVPLSSSAPKKLAERNEYDDIGHVRSSPPPPKKKTGKDQTPSFEQQFGARLPVWIGGIALALAGFFLVKYSIEIGLLTETVRVVLGLIFGAGLLGAAHWIRQKPGIADGTRISQALSGAGIIVFYVSFYAATSLYQLIPQLAGFAGFSAVTVLAVVWSLRYGAPIAVLGMIGGFLTPALVGSQEPNAPLLFTYLFFVLSGLFRIVRRQNWWWLTIPTVLFSFGWVLVWLTTSYSPTDGMWLGLFLLGVSATVVLNSRERIDSETNDKDQKSDTGIMLQYLTLGAAVLLLAVVSVKSNFDLLIWGEFLLLALGGLALAYFRPKVYGFVPWLTMATNAAMLASWVQPESVSLFMAVTIVFGIVYFAAGYVLMWAMDRKPSWAGFMAASGLGYYLLAYYRLRFDFSRFLDDSTAAWFKNRVHLEGYIPAGTDRVWWESFPVWGAVALGLSLLMVMITARFMREAAGSEESRQKTLAILSCTATAFLSIALTIELKHEFLSVAFALQLLATAWIATRLPMIGALRTITGALACVFAFLLSSQILLLIQLTFYSLFETKLYLQQSVPIVNWPLFQLGVPAACFALASILLRRQKDGGLVNWFEAAAVALTGIMGYYLSRNLLHPGENILFIKAGFTERGIITNVFFLYGLGCIFLGQRYLRDTVIKGGFLLAAVASFRICYFDLLLYNPLWTHQSVGNIAFFNSLLLPYGLPIAWLCLLNKSLESHPRARKWSNAFMALLGFTLVSLNIRQIFHGEYLDSRILGGSNAETYTYSAIWLLMGLGMLFMGTLKKNVSIRKASLILVLFTVGKVFLYDASELEGLYRVLSFFGLGISLIGISWFYTRFVFGGKSKE